MDDVDKVARDIADIVMDMAEADGGIIKDRIAARVGEVLRLSAMDEQQARQPTRITITQPPEADAWVSKRSARIALAGYSAGEDKDGS